MRRGILSLLMVLGAAPLPSFQETVPGSGTEVVRLDVLVTDAQGKLVRGLTRDDFDLREDGKPQKLSNFALATRAGQGLNPPADGASSAAPAPAAPTPAAAATPGGTVNVGLERYIAIVVDDLHIARSNVEYTREALARLLDEVVLPEDNVAFVTTSGAVVVPRLTRDRAGLKAAIARLSYREAQIGPARGADITPAQAEMILAGDLTALRLASASVVGEAGSTFESANTSPQAALNNAPGASVSEAPVERAADEQVKRRVRGILQEALHYSGASMVAVADVLRGLASVPGRKICLLLSDGFLIGARTSEERTADLRNIIDAATRSGAVVYTLETRGLVTGSDAAVAGRNVPPGLQVNVSHASEQLNRNTLAMLAEDTGGFLVSDTNDLARGLRLMLEDNESYYLMAYEPTNTKRDGKFRKIELRVPRFKNYKIRTRKGYLAPDDKARAQVAQGPAGAKPAPATALPS